MLLAAGIARALSVQRRTSRALEKWLQGSKVVSDSPVPILQTGNDAPALTVAGVRDVKVLVSEAAAAALSSAELRTAIRHELAHVSAHDNLKKLLFRLALFPGMGGLSTPGQTPPNSLPKMPPWIACRMRSIWPRRSSRFRAWKQPRRRRLRPPACSTVPRR